SPWMAATTASAAQCGQEKRRGGSACILDARFGLLIQSPRLPGPPPPPPARPTPPLRAGPTRRRRVRRPEGMWLMAGASLRRGAVRGPRFLLHRMPKPPVDDLYRLRHSAAHVLAQSVRHLFPEAKLAIGPPTEDGFYYDFDRETPFTLE